jgi:hypothetical protein
MADRDVDWPAATSTALLHNQHCGHATRHSAEETRVADQSAHGPCTRTPPPTPPEQLS